LIDIIMFLVKIVQPNRCKSRQGNSCQELWRFKLSSINERLDHFAFSVIICQVISRPHYLFVYHGDTTRALIYK